MSEREAAIARFLEQHGWSDGQRVVLAGDASFRRYDRLTRGSNSLVLMDAPPPHENIRPFVRVARHLTNVGLAAPTIIAADNGAGLLLLEDLGDDLFSRVLTENAVTEIALYEAAIDVLIALHKNDVKIDLPAYDDTTMLEMTQVLVEWFLPLAEIDMPDQARTDFADIWKNILPLAHAVPNAVILRDYHADNLIWLPDRVGPARVGLLDFQDAMIGPAAYDIVSLLEDARRDVAPATVAAAKARYLAAFSELDPADFETAYAICGAQRNCRIIGVFCRLLARDGKPGYQDWMPRVWEHMARDLKHPANAPLAEWFDRWVPPAKRTRVR